MLSLLRNLQVRKRQGKISWAWLTAFALFVILFLASLPRLPADPSLTFIYPTNRPLPVHAVGLLGTGVARRLVQQWWRYVPAMILAMAGVIAVWRIRGRSALLLPVFLLGPLALFWLLSLGDPAFNTVQLLVLLLPPFLMLVSAGWLYPWRRWRGRAIVLGVVVVGLQLAWLTVQYQGPELRRDDIRTMARLYAATTGASIFQGTCTQDQTANGTQNSRAFSILQAITGNINVPGGWVTSPPPRFGHPGYSVEGDPLGSDQYPLFVDLWGRKSPYGVVTMVPESIPEKLKAFMVIGGNPLISMPDSTAFKSAFEKLDLLVVHDLFMTETAQAAHYVLPACSHLEKWGVAYTYNVCHCLPFLMLRKKCIEPLAESWSEWKFITELAKRLGLEDRFPWASEEEFVAFMVGPSGLSFDYLLNEKPEGDFYAEKEYAIPDKLFRTPTGKIEIYSATLEKEGFDPLPSYLEPERGPVRGDRNFLEKYPLILSVGNRNLYYTHSQQRQVAALKKIYPEPLTEIGPETANKFGIENGDLIVVETNTGQVRMKALVDERVAEGIVLVPHGWGGDANGNLLTDVTCREPIMGYPDQKSLQCLIRKD